ncbi:M61 family metallopeptidase [Pleionea sp. CnH1-48]|uniref:M61 family metallopeptidase n=1 Tax=Pleionea sp. CnH1-48 TaxID=2954494 RepID=UPI00209786BC|nr:PDZ domain-containing protein [Pleionea sp. CnH1-48]MCO7222687.1 PDZ domain-containing protein [Pleionea sp. CnH1-48]
MLPDHHHYRIAVHDAAAHLFEVTLTIAKPLASQSVRLPDWIPGSYMIRDFSKHINQLTAYDLDHKPLTCHKSSKSTWVIACEGGPISVRYYVYAWDLSVRGAHLDQTHGFFNGTSVFLEVVGQSELPCLLSIIQPEFAEAQNWRVATSMPLASNEHPQAAKLYGFGDYWSQDYDELIDHPVEMCDFDSIVFEVAGIPHELVFYGRQRADLDRIARDLTAICEAQIAVFGELPEIERYVFLVTVLGEGYGGLEHRSSTALHCARADLPLVGEDKLSDGYKTFLGLCSHEYFHTWNVKRIKPAVFLPYDLTRETHTPLLWAFEGITSYYDELALVRSGVLNEQEYLVMLAKTVTRVYRGSGRFKQTVTESSYDAWTRFYQQDENAPNAIVSYYTKGALLALCLDLLIRKRSEQKYSLDHVMALLWQEHGRPGVGVEEDTIQKLIKERLNLDLSDFFSMALETTDDLPLAELLADYGVELCWQAASRYSDLGGKPSEQEVSVNLGATVQQHALGAKLRFVYHQSTAHRAGLSSGDIVIAVDQLKVTSANIESRVASYQVGDTIQFHAFRRDELMSFEVELQAADNNTAYFNYDEQNSDTVAGWLTPSSKGE